MKRALLIFALFHPEQPCRSDAETGWLASQLSEFGVEPVVVTVHAQCYEEPNDDSSLSLLPHGLRVERVGALPARICRPPRGYGDMSFAGAMDNAPQGS
jgi:hypothetical protein